MSRKIVFQVPTAMITPPVICGPDKRGVGTNGNATHRRPLLQLPLFPNPPHHPKSLRLVHIVVPQLVDQTCTTPSTGSVPTLHVYPDPDIVDVIEQLSHAVEGPEEGAAVRDRDVTRKNRVRRGIGDRLAVRAVEVGQRLHGRGDAHGYNAEAFLCRVAG